MILYKWIIYLSMHVYDALKLNQTFRLIWCIETQPMNNVNSRISLYVVTGDAWHSVYVMRPLQEMKRVRTEQIQYAVTQYLKRRQYIDTDGSLKGAKLSQSAEEMAASLTGDWTSCCYLNDSWMTVIAMLIFLSFCCVQFRRSPAVRMWCPPPRVSQTLSSMRPSSPDCAPSCRVRWAHHKHT